MLLLEYKTDTEQGTHTQSLNVVLVIATFDIFDPVHSTDFVRPEDRTKCDRKRGVKTDMSEVFQICESPTIPTLSTTLLDRNQDQLRLNRLTQNRYQWYNGRTCSCHRVFHSQRSCQQIPNVVLRQELLIPMQSLTYQLLVERDGSGEE